MGVGASAQGSGCARGRLGAHRRMHTAECRSVRTVRMRAGSCSVPILRAPRCRCPGAPSPAPRFPAASTAQASAGSPSAPALCPAGSALCLAVGSPRRAGGSHGERRAPPAALDPPPRSGRTPAPRGSLAPAHRGERASAVRLGLGNESFMAICGTAELWRGPTQPGSTSIPPAAVLLPPHAGPNPAGEGAAFNPRCFPAGD